MANLPIIAPLLALLQSRKFLVTVAGIIVNLIVLKVPELLPARDILMATISLAALGLVGTIAWEDRAKIARDAAAADPATLEELFRTVVNDVLDTVLKGEPPVDPEHPVG
jgi:hypothetical protein